MIWLKRLVLKIEKSWNIGKTGLGIVGYTVSSNPASLEEYHQLGPFDGPLFSILTMLIPREEAIVCKTSSKFHDCKWKMLNSGALKNIDVRITIILTNFNSQKAARSSQKNSRKSVGKYISRSRPSTCHICWHDGSAQYASGRESTGENVFSYEYVERCGETSVFF